MTALWRRLDGPGHDACRLVTDGDGARIEGTAALAIDGFSAALRYAVACDSSWRARRGEVYGWIGDRPIELVIAPVTGGGWSLNGVEVEAVRGCLDLDFGFTPATNLFQLRRLALAPGQAADDRVAWLDVSPGTLDLLVQRYERRSETTYWYEAKRFGYAALLEIDRSGFVRRYPGLWEAESRDVAGIDSPRG
jgi:uncharacterized protein